MGNKNIKINPIETLSNSKKNRPRNQEALLDGHLKHLLSRENGEVCYPVSFFTRDIGCDIWGQQLPLFESLFSWPLWKIGVSPKTVFLFVCVRVRGLSSTKEVCVLGERRLCVWGLATLEARGVYKRENWIKHLAMFEMLSSYHFAFLFHILMLHGFLAPVSNNLKECMGCCFSNTAWNQDS